MNHKGLFCLLLLGVAGSLGACSQGTPAQPDPHLGAALRRETADLLLAYRDRPALVMSPTYALAEEVFPQLDGWIRVLGATSLDGLRQKAERAAQDGLAYEALAYGLETGPGTPGEEWHDLVGSAQAAREIADRHGKLLVMAPGFRLMSQNEDLYPAMSALADIWVLQTQRLQVYPAQGEYRQEVQRYIQLIRSGNPDIAIWAQITIPPRQEPDANYWLPYHNAIADLVDGTYLGIYTWRTQDPELLTGVMETIFARVYGNEH